MDARSRSGCCSPTRRSATPTSRCWPRACAPTTCCAIAEFVSHRLPKLFSLEMWGGATFDVAMRFLHEDPWQRLRSLREAHSEHLLPDAAARLERRRLHDLSRTTWSREFVDEAAAQGIDIFRIFDSLNWLPNMQVAMEAVRETRSVCEAAICYTGDILDPKRDKYSLKYYVQWRRNWRSMGAHILGIKDMAGLCRPYAAYKLVKALREEDRHSRSTSTRTTPAASTPPRILKAAEAGVDVADGAIASMSGATSQPNLNSIVAALRTRRATPGSISTR